MGYVDAAVLNLVERSCRRFQLLTGRTNVWLAAQLTNLSVAVYFVWAASVYIASGDLAFRVFLTLFLGGVVFVVSRTIAQESVEAAESDAYRRVSKGFLNPRRARDSQLRVAFLSLTVILGTPLLVAYLAMHTVIALLTSSLILLTTVLLYVLACDPLPPCEGKLAARISALARLRPARTT